MYLKREDSISYWRDSQHSPKLCLGLCTLAGVLSLVAVVPLVRAAPVSPAEEVARVSDNSARLSTSTTCPSSRAVFPQEILNSAGSPVISEKNRFISFSFNPLDSGLMQAIHVTLTSLAPPFDVFDGRVRWVGPPFQVCEDSGQGLAISPPNCGPAGQPQGWFWAARLVCGSGNAHFMDWTTLDDFCADTGEACTTDPDCTTGTCGVDGVVHVFGLEVVPDSTYDIRVMEVTCPSKAPTKFSPSETIPTSKWGDVVAPFDIVSNFWPAPDGIVDQNDVDAVLEKFSNLTTAPMKSRSDHEPNGLDFLVGFQDVLIVLNATTGAPYPYVPTLAPLETIDLEPGGRDGDVTDVDTMVDVLLGQPDPLQVAITMKAFAGASVAGGIFTGSIGVEECPDSIGILEGVILSTGDIFDVRPGGPHGEANRRDYTTTVNFEPGDSNLTALLMPKQAAVTFDRAALTFSIETDVPRVLECEFVFASECYNEWVHTRYNDIFGLFVNGINQALIPPKCGGPPLFPPVSINNVNGGNPLGSGAVNGLCYQDNDCNDAGDSGFPCAPPFREAEPDGFTKSAGQSLTLVTIPFVTVPMVQYSVKLAIADAGDSFYNSNVLIRCTLDEFVLPSGTSEVEPEGACCLLVDPCAVISEADCLAVGGTYGGDGTPCASVIGACVVSPTVCLETTQACCTGAYQGDATLCPPIGACCQANGSCAITTEGDCGGMFQGDGTLCEGDKNGDGTDDTCQSPGACCGPNGCMEGVTEARCEGSGFGKYRGDGTTCADVCVCPPPAQPISTLVDTGNGIGNRTLVLETDAVDVGRSQAIRVVFTDLDPPYDVWNGEELWVQVPTARCEHSGTSFPPCPLGPTFLAAPLACSPHFTDWSSFDGPIHMHHEGIIPNSLYTIDVIDVICDVTDKTQFSPPLDVATSQYGDVSAFFSGVDWPPPDGSRDVVSDVIAVLGKFSSLPSAPISSRADLEPRNIDWVINITDVLQALFGFSGLPYPFVPPSVPDPCP